MSGEEIVNELSNVIEKKYLKICIKSDALN
jgi:hypothetical protein